MAIETYIELEVRMWRERFLGNIVNEEHEKLKAYFVATPSCIIIERGPEKVYRECVESYFMNQGES